MTGPKKGSIAQGILLMTTIATVFAMQALSTMSHHEALGKNRKPASVTSLTKIDAIEEDKTFTVQLNCDEFSETKQKSKYPFVRITSDSCAKTKAGEIQMTNVTNGFDATVFQLSEGFTSDLIRLKPGTNRILVIEKFEEGKDLRRTLTVLNH